MSRTLFDELFTYNVFILDDPYPYTFMRFNRSEKKVRDFGT